MSFKGIGKVQKRLNYLPHACGKIRWQCKTLSVVSITKTYVWTRNVDDALQIGEGAEQLPRAPSAIAISSHQVKGLRQKKTLMLARDDLPTF